MSSFKLETPSDVEWGAETLTNSSAALPSECYSEEVVRLRFSTKNEMTEFLKHLGSRYSIHAPLGSRIVESDDPPNHKYDILARGLVRL